MRFLQKRKAKQVANKNGRPAYITNRGVVDSAEWRPGQGVAIEETVWGDSKPPLQGEDLLANRRRDDHI